MTLDAAQVGFSIDLLDPQLAPNTFSCQIAVNAIQAGASQVVHRERTKHSLDGHWLIQVFKAGVSVGTLDVQQRRLWNMQGAVALTAQAQDVILDFGSQIFQIGINRDVRFPPTRDSQITEHLVDSNLRFHRGGQYFLAHIIPPSFRANAWLLQPQSNPCPGLPVCAGALRC